MEPSIGRIVHFRHKSFTVESTEGHITVSPAIILAVNENGTCDLLVWTAREGDQRVYGAARGDGDWLNTWSWPPRV